MEHNWERGFKPAVLLVTLVLAFVFVVFFTGGCGKGGGNGLTVLPDEDKITSDVASGDDIGSTMGALGFPSGADKTAVVLFSDNFKTNYLDPEKWTDYFVYDGTVVESLKNRLSFRSSTPDTSAMLIPVHYFKVDPGEQVEASVKMINKKSEGETVLQGFSIYDGKGGGVSVGVFNGSDTNRPTIGGVLPNVYISSQSDWLYDWCMAYVPKTDGTYKISYKNGFASVLFNGDEIGRVAARLDGENAVFMLNGYAGLNSYFDMYFENFATNQMQPGDENLKVRNNTRPFLSNGSGGLKPGESFTLRFEGTHGLGSVMGRMYDAVNYNTMVDFEMRETSVPGVYEYTGIMPSSAPAKVVFSASECAYGYGGSGCFSSLMPLFTRKIPTSSNIRVDPTRGKSLSRPTGLPQKFPMPGDIIKVLMGKSLSRTTDLQRTAMAPTKGQKGIVKQCMNMNF